MIEKWIEKLGLFNFETQQNARKDIHQADFLSGGKNEENGLAMFVAALRKNDTGS